MNFVEMGIPIGSQLDSIHRELVAIVLSPKKVLFDNQEISLTAATRQVLGLEYNVQPSPHWTFQGKHLSDIYHDTYENIGEN